jgi:RNA methyltransferase, TrmH family
VKTTITSRSNDKIKYVVSLARRAARYAERRFVVEGPRLLEEALRAGLLPALILYTEDFAGRPEGSRLLARAAEIGAPADEVPPRLLEEAADTVTPQGVLAVVPFPELAAPAQPTLVLVVDGVATPGNLGTLLRSAEAAGVQLVLLAPGTTDPFSPKVVRGGMGAHFRLPIVADLDWEALRSRLAGLAVFLAEAGGGQAYYDVDWTGPSALLVGSEAHGPSPEACALAGEAIHIPMAGDPESLNAGVAGSVILFEAARQRRLSTTRARLGS